MFEKVRELLSKYIIRKDNTGGELKRRLVEKARQGVRVYVVYDEVGSPDLIESSLTELRDAGVDVRRFNTTQGRANRWQLNFRNQRVATGSSARSGCPSAPARQDG